MLRDEDSPFVFAEFRIILLYIFNFLAPSTPLFLLIYFLVLNHLDLELVVILSIRFHSFVGFATLYFIIDYYQRRKLQYAARRFR